MVAASQTSENTAGMSPPPATTPLTPRVSVPMPSSAQATPLSKPIRGLERENSIGSSHHHQHLDSLRGEAGATTAPSNHSQSNLRPPSSSHPDRRGSVDSRKSRKSQHEPQHGWLWAGEGVTVPEMSSQFFDEHISQLAGHVARMLQDIVEINDRIPFDAEKLTRFHSRAPPGISIRDYLVRIIRFCNIDKIILVVLLYFIDLFSQSYKNFNINTLTIHRFIITGVTVASKGLCDTYCENTFYAKVGGISVVELNLLEVEFLTRVAYRIVPRPGLVAEYYSRMLEREAAVAADISVETVDRRTTPTSLIPELEQPGRRKHARSSSLSPAPSADGKIEQSTIITSPANTSHGSASASLTPAPAPAESSTRTTLRSTMKKLLHPAKKKKAED